MQLKLLEVLACPTCLCSLTCRADEHEEDAEIITGTLTCGECREEYPIIDGIPRFVPRDNYAASFGYQWNWRRATHADPQRTMRTLPRVLRPGGRIAITAYERKPWTMLYAKYWLRPLTKRVDKHRLLSGIKSAMPVLFPLTNLLFRLPLAGRLFMFAIPVANYVHERALTRQQRYDWAILDTFDILSPQYLQPRTQQEVEEALTDAGVIEIKRLPNPGLDIVGRKGA